MASVRIPYDKSGRFFKALLGQPADLIKPGRSKGVLSGEELGILPIPFFILAPKWLQQHADNAANSNTVSLSIYMIVNITMFADRLWPKYGFCVYIFFVTKPQLRRDLRDL